jgi:hypothetical protein
MVPEESVEIQHTNRENGKLSFLRLMFKNHPNDERLKLLRYKGGYYGLMVTILFIIAEIVFIKLLKYPDQVDYRVLLLIPFFGGTFTNILYLQFTGYIKAARENFVSSANWQERMKASVAFSMIFTPIYWWGCLQLFPGMLEFSGAVGDILYSLLMGFIVTSVEWWNHVSMRKKYLAQQHSA